MEVQITDLKNTAISGVRSLFPDSYDTYREDYFEWTAFPLVSEFKTGKVTTGLLEGWHHTPGFSVIEWHEDNEIFCFLDGTALMLFVDIENSFPVMESAQIVRIPAGVTLEVAKGKGHFVAVAEGCCYKAIVVSPVQDAPRIALSETIVGKSFASMLFIHANDCLFQEF